MKKWQKMLSVGATMACTAVLSLSASAQTNCNASTGPDVIVGDLNGVANYASPGSLEALSLGTTSCNIGTVWLNWIQSTNQHPVIGGALYRYRVVDGAGRFEQLGQSWLKHGFFALSQSLCCSGCQATDGTHLGVKCSDPYTASRNGSQGGLGPRWQVDAHTGFYPFPPANPPFAGTTARRLEVEMADLATTDRYFGEGMYVTPDDAAAGNQNNNASHREIAATGSGLAWNFAFVGATQREKQAVRAWKAIDPAVNQQDVLVPGEGGLMILSSRVTDLGAGQWRYEYSLYNMNSTIAAYAFSLPIPAGVNATNIEFHDVDYRNGDGPGSVNFSGTDWTVGNGGGTLSWTGQTQAQNVSGNAIRWGTAYNFRFDANVGPATGPITIGLYKTGGSMVVNGDVPSGAGPAVGTPFCYGDGSDPQVTNLCPCFNLGAPGRGCDNSAGTGGAELTVSGTVSPDTVVLTSSNELATSLSIFLQGNAQVSAGAVFGDGVRCVGGQLKRIGTKNAVGGVATYPQGGDPSITTQSAALGDPIAPGSTRYYQTYYRDPNLAFCAAPMGDAFNVSNGQIIVW